MNILLSSFSSFVTLKLQEGPEFFYCCSDVPTRHGPLYDDFPLESGPGFINLRVILPAPMGTIGMSTV